MSLFINLSLEQRRKLFNAIKSKIGKWGDFYPRYKISRAMFFNYLSGKNGIPIVLFNHWKKLANFKERVEIIEKETYLKKEIRVINLDESLSEIIGVLNGDGHISKNKKEICVVGSKHEKNYAIYIKNLFSRKFGIDFHLFFYKNYFKLKGYSVVLSDMLINKYGLPNGNKIGRLHISLAISSKRELLIRYIKGLFDTDGTFYLRRKNDGVIEISSIDINFLLEIKSALKSLGFNVSLLKNHIAIYRDEEIKAFFDLIRPANSKHLKNYQNYLKNKRR